MNLALILAIFVQTAAGGAIQGVVLNESSEPLNTARVEIIGPQGPASTRTDSQGQFLFSDVPPGRHLVSVKKEGYIRQEYGQKTPGGKGSTVVIEAGRRSLNIVFRLQPAATIHGVVGNEDGFPIANILVQAMKRGYDDRGKRTLTAFSSTLTNDRGVYRLYWMDPGDYYVSAAYLPALPTPVNADEDVSRAAYAPTYFPGTSDPAEAKPVHVESRDTKAADFTLKRSPAVTVRGTIRSALTGEGQPATVTLISPEESGSTMRYSTQADGKGIFEMKGINAGSYAVAVRDSDGDVGFSKINVLDIDYPRADVIAGKGVSIVARLFGDAPPAADLRALRVHLSSLEPYIPAPDPASTQANGSLMFFNIQPGDYLLRVSGLPDGGYVKAAQSAQRDVLEQFMSVQYGSTVPLDIQLAFDGGQVSGVALDTAGRPADEATVVLVPDTGRRHRPDQYRAATSGSDGKFSISGIPPGAYKMFAWESVENNAWLNSDFMASYEEYGAAVSVPASAKLSSQTRVIPRSE